MHWPEDQVGTPSWTVKGKRTCRTLVTRIQKNIDCNALSVHGPTLLNIAMMFKERIDKDYFKDIAH